MHRFNFSQTSLGEYLLEASTDDDEDFIVSYQGKEVGSYPE